MKLLITLGLSDRSVQNHIEPILTCDCVDEIFIVRDKMGPRMEKVIYLTPPGWMSGMKILTTFYKFLLLIRHSLREKPDLVHGFLLSPHGIIAFLAGRITGRNVGVSLIAGPVEAYLTPFEFAPIGKYVYSKQLPEITGFKKVLMMILKRFDLITVTGSYTRDFLVRNQIPDENIFTMPHIVDSRFSQQNVEKKCDLIFVGRLVPVKHVETLIRATAIIREKIPSVKTLIVGEGPEFNFLQALSGDLDIHENIVFAGYEGSVWNCFNKAKISVVSSEREGFPYTVVESLSCGVPVVSSHCGDVADVIQDHINGIIIDIFDDYNMYAKEIVNLLENPEILKKYQDNALLSSTAFSIENVKKKWEEILIGVNS